MIRSSSRRPGSGSRLARRIKREEDGVTLTEFGLVAPILFLMLTGIFDMAHGVYTTALVNGAMQAAARDLTIEGATLRETQLDQNVLDQVRAVVPNNATVTLGKKTYAEFNDVGRPEDFTDTNNDGICNNGEPFVDVNGNNQWDADRGRAGLGGARDVMLYTVRVSYPRLFPIYNFIGLPQNATISGSTVLRNQPFDEQTRTSTVRNCP
ncbi:MAG: TadE/TadG family type IV pilus assembly protein [Erythrobacter sp.]